MDMRFLLVDLTSGLVQNQTIDPTDAKLYVGGRGLGVRLLFDHTPAGLDPFDPAMAIVFAVGPLTGTHAPQSNRFTVSTKSPLTGGLADSHCGGNFATKLRKAGFFAIVIRGKSSHPVYLEVTEAGGTLHDAAHLWGKDTQETQRLLPRAVGKAVIGPAGENRVRFACIVSQNRVAGRTGTGAVMGSKNLKAITADGNLPAETVDQSRFKRLQKRITQFLLGHPMTGHVLPTLGTANLVQVTARRGIIPTNNFRQGHHQDTLKLSGEVIRDQYLHSKDGCLSCPIRCGRHVRLDPIASDDNASQMLHQKDTPERRVEPEPVVDPHPIAVTQDTGETQAMQGKPARTGKGPEFESLAMLGNNLNVFDPPSVFAMAQLCDDLGMDTVSMGNTLGFATELAERGVLNSGLAWGNVEAYREAIVNTAHRRGLGNWLADGTKRLAARVGGESFAMHVKGLELPAYDPRGCVGQGLEYAVNNRGGCHIRAGTMFFEATGPVSIDPHSTKAKPELFVLLQNTNAAISCLSMCYFAAYALVPGPLFKLDPQGLPYRTLMKTLLNAGPVMRLILGIRTPVQVLWFEQFLSATIGRRVTMGELNEIGERVVNLERMYNLREGWTAADDTLPGRLLTEPLGDHPPIRVDEMLARYYRIRGWSSDGVPTEKTLARLGVRN